MTSSSTMAASTVFSRLLSGPLTSLTVAHRSPDAWLLTTPEFPLAVSLVTPRAVLLPNSLVVSMMPPGSPLIRVGEGFLWYDDRPIPVHRWFSPPQVVRGALPLSAAPPRRIRAFLAGWRDHLGKGEGLTPYGDDVICGAMLGLLAVDHQRAGWLSRQIRETDLESRTTAVSAALLRCAAEGWCIPEFDRVLRALSAEGSAPGSVSALLDVGHSSGRGLLAGLARVVDVTSLGVAA